MVVVTECGSPYHDRVCTKMLGYLSVKLQSVTGGVTSWPVSQSPGRRSLGSSPTILSAISATTRQPITTAATSRSLFMWPGLLRGSGQVRQVLEQARGGAGALVEVIELQVLVRAVLAVAGAGGGGHVSRE